MRKYLMAAMAAAAMLTAVQAKAETFKDTRDVATQVCSGANQNPDIKWCEGAAAGVYIVLQNDNATSQMAKKTCSSVLDTVTKTANPNVFVVQVTSVSGAYASCEVGPWPKVTISYNAGKGGFTVNGTIDGNPTQFTVDTGATGTVLNRKFAASLGPLAKAGSEKVQLADGRILNKTLYWVHNVCLGGMCADKLQVALVDGENLLGLDFMAWADVWLAINGDTGVMTLIKK
jgi:predicted aspartyl protease